MVYNYTCYMQAGRISNESRLKLLQYFKQTHTDDKIPIIIYFTRQKSWSKFKQYMIISMKSSANLHQFTLTLQLKLVLSGYLNQQNKSLYLFTGKKQLSSSGDIILKEVYNSYKSKDGWLELHAMHVNAF